MSEALRMPQNNHYASLTPGLDTRHDFTRRWLEQAILRMRRELTWLWRNHQPIDALAEALERRSLTEQRKRFFDNDAAAHYLNERIEAHDLPLRARGGKRGTLPWLARELELSRAELFVIALALAAARDAAVGNLIATLHGDARQQLPTLGLAQWLWDESASLLPLMSPAHPLFARGILRRPEAPIDWQTGISMPPIVAEILEGGLDHCPAELECVAEPGSGMTAEGSDLDIELLASRMMHSPSEVRIVPVALPFANDALHAKRALPALEKISAQTGRPVYAIRSNVVVSSLILENAAAFCWLRGFDLLLPSQGMASCGNWQNVVRPFPIYVFAATGHEALEHDAFRLPTLTIAVSNYDERRSIWQHELGRHRLQADAEAVRECAYRFRLDAGGIAEVVTALRRFGKPLTLEQMVAACQQQVGQQIGAQASLVAPRFHRDDLVLDPQAGTQFDELLAAMRNLSRVHADWGTGAAWSDAGISAMFAGAPGTGKTMAAEVLAAELRLPMYRVDLSQVVNKYIGETEKNLRKLFDAAEQADLVLFFDEAESLFGQRMQARNSNDRFANIEVSYLLERMERFRGLAILATNRKKDLDEAFLRRLRYVIEFPMPAKAERLAIWKKSIPRQVSCDEIDLDFLAHEFALSGGNIRSIVLNACLQSATKRARPSLRMDAIMTAVDREYEKLGRPLTREQKMQWQFSSGANMSASSIEVTG
jgi:ATPase family associated with various cellular activities (AAA)